MFRPWLSLRRLSGETALHPPLAEARFIGVAVVPACSG